LQKILLLCDDDPVGRHLASALAEEWDVSSAVGGLDSAVEQVRSRRPDVLMLAGGNDFPRVVDILGNIRAGIRAPVIYASFCAPLEAKVAVLDGGADDFITLPCGAGELRARVRAQLRRCCRPEASQVFRVGSLAIDMTRKIATREASPVRFTNLQYRILEALIDGQGAPVASTELIRRVWGPALARVGNTSRLRASIKGLRVKLEPECDHRARFLITIPRFGYQLRFASEQIGA